MEIRAAINWLLSMTKNIKDENGHPRMHHEINLSDTKMVATQKLKTVVGHPIKVIVRGLFMEEFSIYTYLNIILICSLIGFVTENIWLIFRYGYFDNRNMNLPFLLGYGVSFVLLYKLIGLPEEMPDIKYFMSVMFIVSAGEIILGTLVEKVCHIHYWDYSSLPFHLTRYTSLFTSIGFAVAVTLFMRECFPRISFYLSENETVMMKFVGIFGNIVLFLDFLYSFKKCMSRRACIRNGA